MIKKEYEICILISHIDEIKIEINNIKNKLNTNNTLKMYIIHSEKKYRIEELSEHSTYFDTLKSSNFSENQNGYLDLSHRGQPMKDVLDMMVRDISLSDLSYLRLNEMKPILDELSVSESWLWHFDENNYWCVIGLAFEKERKEQILINAQEKEGKHCHQCCKINKWLIPNCSLDWEERRDYCDCDYVRTEFGDRMTQKDFLNEYYSDDENCKHGSSTW